jgi:hypothetical protein
MSTQRASHPDPDNDRKMTRRQEQIETVLYAWKIFLPTAAMPNIGQIFKWLGMSDLSSILTLIETAAARTDLYSPRYWIPNVLCNRRHEASNGA